MKKVYFFASLALMMMFAACSSDDNDINDDTAKNFDSEEITVGVGLPDGDNTRASFGNSIGELLWNSGDVLTCVGRSEGKPIYPSEFKIDPLVTEDVSSASFSGKVLTDETYKYEFAYVGGDIYQNINVTYDYENNTWNCEYLKQQQSSYNNYSNLKNHLFMISDPLSKAELKSGTPVVLHHKSSIMKINVKDFADVLANSNEFNVNLYFNYVEGGNNIPASTVKLIAYDALTENNYVYIAFDPSNQLSKGGVIAVEFLDIKNQTATCIARGTSTNGKQYVAGKVYTLTAGKAGTNLIWDKAQEPEQPEAYEIPRGFTLVKNFSFATQEDLSDWSFNPDGWSNSYSFDTTTTPTSLKIEPGKNDYGTYSFTSPQVTLRGKIANNPSSAAGINVAMLDFTEAYKGSNINAALVVKIKYKARRPATKKIAEISDMKGRVNIVLPKAANGRPVEFIFEYNRKTVADTGPWNLFNFVVSGHDTLKELPK